MRSCQAVLRIHDILGWIRIHVSANGSGSCYFRHWPSRCQQKTNFSTQFFSAYYFLKLNLHHFSKIKCQKEPQNSRNQGYSYYFWMMIEGSGSGSRAGSGSGSIPLIGGSGSGSGRPKNIWIRWIRIRIRIRIRNTVAKWLERLTSNVELSLVSIPAFYDTVESEGRQMKQCWIKTWKQFFPF